MNKEEIVKLLMWLGDCYDMDDRENAEKCADSYISENEPKALNLHLVMSTLRVCATSCKGIIVRGVCNKCKADWR